MYQPIPVHSSYVIRLPIVDTWRGLAKYTQPTFANHWSVVSTYTSAQLICYPITHCWHLAGVSQVYTTYFCQPFVSCMNLYQCTALMLSYYPLLTLGRGKPSIHNLLLPTIGQLYQPIPVPSSYVSLLPIVDTWRGLAKYTQPTFANHLSVVSTYTSAQLLCYPTLCITHCWHLAGVSQVYTTYFCQPFVSCINLYQCTVELEGVLLFRTRVPP